MFRVAAFGFMIAVRVCGGYMKLGGFMEKFVGSGFEAYH